MQDFTRISGEIDSLYHEAAFKLGQSDSAMTILYMLLANKDRCEVSEICRLSGAKKQTINSALRKLEDEGIVKLTIKSHKNRSVSLTEKGKVTALRSAGTLMKIEDEAISDWTEEEMEYYLKLSARFLENFRMLVKNIPEEGEKE